ncbi:uncharacterized protein LOC114915446 [Cajanus cajan]|uniref:uncharacterized protein LOC114915446 n=1 Tax=Cajanus cajan TaxID=3821 RepID=UPI0010FB1A1B|nr:uncharacterized protein LOC114915446 [Cajanus cajan]
MICPRGIKLTSLEYLSLRNCINLVILPEILLPMNKLKFVDLGGTSIKGLPLSMQNLEGLQILSLEGCKKLEIDGSFNFFQMLPQFFHNLTQLILRDSNLTILPGCIEKCHSLKHLDVSNCKRLQEIRGLPRNTTHFWAHRTLVEADSSTLNMLLRRAIVSSTICCYSLQGQRIPEWFDHSTKGNSMCLWFRNHFPSLTGCVVLRVCDDIKPPYHMKFNFFISINDTGICVSCFSWGKVDCVSKNGHIFVLNLQPHFHHPLDLAIERALSTKEWIRGDVLITMGSEEDRSLGVVEWIGVYVNRAFSSMEDVRFTYPYSPNDTHVEGT